LIPSTFLLAIERVALTLWIGGLWVTGLVFAPALFSAFGRSVAGATAGQLFSSMSRIGLASGMVLLGLTIWQSRSGVWRDWRAGVIVLMLILMGAGEFVLAARMRELKFLAVQHPEAVVTGAEFGRLHGLASIVYGVEWLLGLLLVVRQPRCPIQAGN